MALDRKYAIPKIMNHKSAGAVKRSLDHSYREKLMPEAKERIDPTRAHLNIYSGKNVAEKITTLEKRLKPYETHMEGYRKLQTGTKDGKHDSVICTEYVITMSPEIAKKLTVKQRDSYFDKSVKMLANQYGAKNILAVALHRDEDTDHAHVYCIPEIVTKKTYKMTSREKAKQKKDPNFVSRDTEIRSLSSSFYLGSKEKMRVMWDKLAEIGKEFGMIRGRRGSHLASQSHKKYHEEAKEVEKMVGEMFEPRGVGLSKESPKKILERLKPAILDVYLENLSLQNYAKEHEKEAEKSNEPRMRNAIMAYYKMTNGLTPDEKKNVVEMVEERVAKINAQKAEKEKEYQKTYRDEHKPVNKGRT